MMPTSRTSRSLRLKTDGSPIHYRIQQEIRRRIESGQWAPGSVIPPERKMADDYAVSLGTVRTAILSLVSEGLLHRIQGKGTLVSVTKIMRESIRYYRLVNDFNRKEAATKLKLLDIETIGNRPDINHHFKIRAGESLYRLRRLVLIIDKPVVYCISFLPCNLFRGLDEFPRSKFERVPLYLALEDHFGVPTLSNTDLISAVAADAETAALLRIPEGRPILEVEMLAFSYRRRPYEYRISYCLTEGRKLLRKY
jgi:GntR family transcriptional regulator